MLAMGFGRLYAVMRKTRFLAMLATGERSRGELIQKGPFLYYDQFQMRLNRKEMKPNDFTCRMYGACCRINPVKPEKCRTFPFEWSNPDSAEVCPALAKAKTRREISK